MIELLEIANKLSGLSLASLLTVIIWGSAKDYWCWSRDRNEFRADRDRWQALALENLGLAKKAVDHAARTESGPPIERR
jgi:hypothetical protein